MNRKKKYGWWKHIDFMIIDLICIQIAYVASYFFRHDTLQLYRETSLYAHVNILLIIIDLCYVLLRGTYKNILKRSFIREIESVLVHNIIMWGLVMAYLYVTKQAFWFSRQVFLTFLWIYDHFHAGRQIFVEAEHSTDCMERKKSAKLPGNQHGRICDRDGSPVF